MVFIRPLDEDSESGQDESLHENPCPLCKRTVRTACVQCDSCQQWVHRDCLDKKQRGTFPKAILDALHCHPDKAKLSLFCWDCSGGKPVVEQLIEQGFDREVIRRCHEVPNMYITMLNTPFPATTLNNQNDLENSSDNTSMITSSEQDDMRMSTPTPLNSSPLNLAVQSRANSYLVMWTTLQMTASTLKL